MLDKDTTVDDAQTVFCPTCEENYRLAWSGNKESLFVVCDCYEAEQLGKFSQRFLAEHVDGVTAEPDDSKMYA